MPPVYRLFLDASALRAAKESSTYGPQIRSQTCAVSNAPAVCRFCASPRCFDIWQAAILLEALARRQEQPAPGRSRELFRFDVPASLDFSASEVQDVFLERWGFSCGKRQRRTGRSERVRPFRSPRRMRSPAWTSISWAGRDGRSVHSTCPANWCFRRVVP